MKIIFYPVFLLILLSSFLGVTGNVHAATNIPRDFKIKDSELNQSAFDFYLKYLWDVYKKMPEIDPENKETIKEYSDFLNSSRFYLVYPNSLLIIEGYFLKQEALLEKTKYDLAKEKAKSGEVTKEELAEAKKRYEEARKKYKQFLKTTPKYD
jgi:tetratricopeptide (TPR) repeat protein